MLSKRDSKTIGQQYERVSENEKMKKRNAHRGSSVAQGCSKFSRIKDIDGHHKTIPEQPACSGGGLQT